MGMRKLMVVSACFYDNETPAYRLIHSCKKLRLDLSLYGIKEFGCDWRNMKVVKLLKHLNEIECEYVLYTDAGDSWMTNVENNIIDKFILQKTKVLISGERNMYPFFECDYPKPENYTEKSLRYICAGGFMGKREDVIHALKLLLEYEVDGNDQYLWHRLFLDKKFDMKIDYNADIFLSMGGIELNELNFNRPYGVIYEDTKKSPCTIHFNGGKGGSQNEQNMITAWEIFYPMAKIT